jgi:hypothetical protein
MQVVYLSDNGSPDPDQVKTPKISVSRIDATPTVTEVYNKELGLTELLEAIKFNCYEFLIKGDKFRPDVSNVAVNETTGEVNI